MRPDLTRKIIQELRNETCPPEVLDKVRRRLVADARPAMGRRGALAFATAVLILAGGLWAWRLQVNEHHRQQVRLVAEASANRTRVILQTEDALGWVGSVLASAGDRSEKIISKGAVAPLRDSYELTKNKLIPKSEL